MQLKFFNRLQAVKRKMMSDVPWGVLLSGGLDSSLVASIATRFINRNKGTVPSLITQSHVLSSPLLHKNYYNPNTFAQTHRQELRREILPPPPLLLCRPPRQSRSSSSRQGRGFFGYNPPQLHLHHPRGQRSTLQYSTVKVNAAKHHHQSMFLIAVQ